MLNFFKGKNVNKTIITYLSVKWNKKQYTFYLNSKLILPENLKIFTIT